MSNMLKKGVFPGQNIKSQQNKAVTNLNNIIVNCKKMFKSFIILIFQLVTL